MSSAPGDATEPAAPETPGPGRAAALAVAKAAGEVLALGDAALAHRLAVIALETDAGAPSVHSVMTGVPEGRGAFDAAVAHRRRAAALATRGTRRSSSIAGGTRRSPGARWPRARPATYRHSEARPPARQRGASPRLMPMPLTGPGRR